MSDLLEVRTLRKLESKVEYKGLINAGLVAPSPRAAVKRIEAEYGEVPNRLGTNCQGLDHIRRIISELADNEEICHALSIVAPHTHWPPAPVIHRFDAEAECYWVGPDHGTGPFRAISFTFHPDGPIPYEWADSSCDLSDGEMKRVWQFIIELNSQAIHAEWFSAPYPFGLSVNFRFKSPFSPAPFSTHEKPTNKGKDWSCVERVISTDNLNNVHRDQVGWSSAIPPEISEADQEALNVLNGMLSELPASEVEAILANEFKG